MLMQMCWNYYCIYFFQYEILESVWWYHCCIIRTNYFNAFKMFAAHLRKNIKRRAIITPRKNQSARKYLRSRVSIKRLVAMAFGNCSSSLLPFGIFTPVLDFAGASVFVSLAISLAARCVYTRRTHTYVSTYDHQLPPLSSALHPSKYKASFNSVDGMVYWSLRRKQKLSLFTPLRYKYKRNISALTIVLKHEPLY